MDADRLPPGLYIVATPIGNLGDLSPRAAETLRRVDLVLAEDKRVSAKLLAFAGAKARMATYHDHSSEAERDAIVARLGSEAIALISDAGTPLISDPGYKLVRAARAAGHQVHTLPGPSAVIAALTLSGLPTDRFLFAGFLPPKAKARADAIAELAGIRATLAFYESGPRLGDTLAALRDGLGHARRGGRSRNQQAPRGMRHRAAAGTRGPLRRQAAQGRNRDRRRTSGRAGRSQRRGTRLRAQSRRSRRLSPSRAAAEVATALNVPKKRAYARALELSR